MLGTSMPLQLCMKDLRIRPASPEDLRDVLAIFSCPSVYAGTLQLPYPSAEVWRKRLTSPADEMHQLVVQLEDRVIAHASLACHPRPRRKHVAGVGIAVHEEWQHQGIGSALMAALINLADDWLNLTRLELEVFVDNQAAIRLYERAGFETEGRLRQYAFRQGHFADVLSMARIRPSEGV